MPKCLVCLKRPAPIHPVYGALPCLNCTNKSRKLFKREVVEFTSEDIKQQRKAYAGDIIQPFRKGELSKEYVDKWGAGSLAVTQEEVKNAKKVWDEGYYKE